MIQVEELNDPVCKKGPGCRSLQTVILQTGTNSPVPLVDIIHKKYTLNWANYLNVNKVNNPTRSENLSVFKTRQRNTVKEESDF